MHISSLEESIKVGEERFNNLRPNTEKKIIWADKSSIKTKISLVFIHGFSASRFELNPVIENVAKELGANIFFTRLTGHGQDGQSLADATLKDWIKDTDEAIKIGAILGDSIVLIGSSTGCSLIHTILEQQQNISSVIYVSPNFGAKSIKGQLLRIPGIKNLLPIIFGKEISFSSQNPDHKKCWTLSYPPEALLAIKDSVMAARNCNHSKIKVPILFWFSDEDKVVSAKATRRIMSKMGGNISTHNPPLSNEDDPSRHGILGDILSPSQTPNGVSKIVDWLKINT